MMQVQIMLSQVSGKNLKLWIQTSLGSSLKIITLYLSALGGSLVLLDSPGDSGSKLWVWKSRESLLRQITIMKERAQPIARIPCKMLRIKKKEEVRTGATNQPREICGLNTS
jgi:hypothetical protein